MTRKVGAFCPLLEGITAFEFAFSMIGVGGNGGGDVQKHGDQESSGKLWRKI